MIPQKQLSLADIFEDCKDIFDSDKPRFKQDFLPDLQSVFDKLVDITEPICQYIDGYRFFVSSNLQNSVAAAYRK